MLLGGRMLFPLGTGGRCRMRETRVEGAVVGMGLALGAGLGCDDAIGGGGGAACMLFCWGAAARLGAGIARRGGAACLGTAVRVVVCAGTDLLFWLGVDFERRTLLP